MFSNQCPSIMPLTMGALNVKDEDPMTLDELLRSEVRVINVGLEAFATDLEKQNVPVVHVLWKPPAGGNPRLADLLSKLGS